jgi:hypothetical protein
VQYGGEVQPCAHPYHLTVTPENTPEKTAALRSLLRKLEVGDE